MSPGPITTPGGRGPWVSGAQDYPAQGVCVNKCSALAVELEVERWRLVFAAKWLCETKEVVCNGSEVAEAQKK